MELTRHLLQLFPNAEDGPLVLQAQSREGSLATLSATPHIYSTALDDSEPAHEAGLPSCISDRSPRIISHKAGLVELHHPTVTTYR